MKQSHGIAAVIAVVAIASLVVAGALALRGQGTDPGSATAAPATSNPSLTVATTTARREMLTLTLAANGNIAAWQEASVGAEAASGQRITEVRASIGDRVRRGQVLATLSTDTLGAEEAQARAAYAEMQAVAAEAQANAQRARTLQPTGALSASQINQYLTAAQTAQSRVEAARAVLQSRQLRLAQAQVLAPDDGIVSARSATVGAIIGAGSPELFRLIRQGRLEWRAEVTAQELARLKPGVTATVTTAAGAQLQGRVRTIGPTVDPQTRTALVYVDVRPVPGSTGHALPGMFARGEFQLGSATALTVPQSSVAVREGFSYVMRVNPDNRISALKVQTGRAAGDRIEILDGLSADARIVASGGGFLNDGDLVRVVEAAPSAAPAEASTQR